MKKACLLCAALMILLASPTVDAQENAETFRKDFSILTQDRVNLVPISVISKDESLLENFSDKSFKIIPIYASSGFTEARRKKPGQASCPDPEKTERWEGERSGESVVEVVFDLSSIQLEGGARGYYIIEKGANGSANAGLDNPSARVPVKKPSGWLQYSYTFNSAWGSWVGAQALNGCHTAIAWNGDYAFYHSPLFASSHCPESATESVATYERATVQVEFNGNLSNTYKVWGAGVVIYH